ncbi:hypothetical protein SCLCIDRAFT_751043 [Scleroderma citrinum Foug A]|uniref:Xylanolytic transcriptional activator regulatory domain-containing protein n=1 Tax=Scleroderma citrinum Foug A TaxID=1036808 RepID=A0A0C2ZD06_9AGAM|nr:hypothetical protein SCLCIDRAFT_751043 [Scleroderma citrinum Foug A]
MDEIFPEYYHTSIPTDDKPHQLALLFLVFAIGALVDLNQALGNTEAEHFHHVARAAMCLRSIIEKPSFETIQALHLLSIYNALSGNELAGQETSMETTWSLVSLAAHLSHTLGLRKHLWTQRQSAELTKFLSDRDSARWDLHPKEVERRRVLSWDLFVLDSWNSLDAGRPPVFNEADVDCKYPQNPTEHDRDETGKQQLHKSWDLRFARECVAEVSARTLITDSPSYSTIMELDRKPQNKGSSVAELLGRFVMSNAREAILLYIHRSYFSQAIIENPDNPSKSTYANSFIAAYRASTTILHTFKAQFDAHGGLICRFWPIWSYLFSAAMVLGTIVVRGPRCPMAASAMKELHDTCTSFSKGAKYSRRAQKALVSCPAGVSRDDQLPCSQLRPG